MKRETDLPYAYLLLEEGIMYVTYKEGYLELEGARQVVQARHELSAGRDYPVLVDDRGMKGMSKEARDYLSHEDGLKYVKAGAILAQSGFTMILGNFFLKVSGPEIPARLFTSKQKALTWLQQFVE